jgi:hypothetical protein
MVAILADLQGKRASYKADMEVAEAKRKTVRKAKREAAAEFEAKRMSEVETAAKFAADVAEDKRKAELFGGKSFWGKIFCLLETCAGASNVYCKTEEGIQSPYRCWS